MQSNKPETRNEPEESFLILLVAISPLRNLGVNISNDCALNVGLSNSNPYGWKFEWKDWISSAIFLPICLYFVLNRGEYTLLDNANLIIHEAGHFIFAFFGKFIRFAGGTIMQILLPCILIYHFYVHDYRLGVQVFLFWLGHNLINISVYAADARARRLPLLGGDFVQHDWWTMLGMLNMLEYDQVIGNLFFGAAILVFIVLLLTPRFMMN